METSINTSSSSSHNRQSDVIIVGAGVAGSALAYALAKDGRGVHVIERDLTEPKRMVGELLQPGGYLKLLDLGLQDCVSGIDAQQVLGYVLYMDGRSLRAPYPQKNYSNNCSDPLTAGRTFHHGRFVQSLRIKAASLPNVKLERGIVTSLIKEKGTIKGVRYKNKSGTEMVAHASLTIVCDGCFSNLRRFLCNTKVDKVSHLVGWVAENYELPHANHGHIVISDPCAVLIYSISSTQIRCFVDVFGQNLPSISTGEMSHYLKSVVAPKIPPELYSMFMSSIDKRNMKAIPCCSKRAVPHCTPGAFLIGDALNIRHPLTGGGMTVALSDVVILRDLLRPLHDLNDATATLEHLQSFYTLRKPMAATINTIADVVYRSFGAPPNESSMEIRRACYDFLSNAEDSFVTESFMALISGLSPCRLKMILLCFYIAIYMLLGRLLLPFPSPKRLLSGARLILDSLSLSLVWILRCEALIFFSLCYKNNRLTLMSILCDALTDLCIQPDNVLLRKDFYCSG
ncbi:hypothetical protein LWI28_026503 [Acer negundo]|uniref:Squalene monooxygenase n=1 Tax=Acer negundo TaxID=4023 RepID=A0AAD5J2Q5_ACENE|nr:hypothetical protein LWI28_026503 [Acer negundo]